MSCTAEQIAEKRRLAMEKLKQTKASAQNNQSAGPTPQSNNATSPGTNAKSFYGNGRNEKANQLNQYESKMKQQQQTPGHSNRISSQPYPRNASAQYKTTNNNQQKMASIFKNVVTCTCVMISPRRFQVIHKGYHAKLIDVFKTIPTRSYGKLFGSSPFPFEY